MRIVVTGASGLLGPRFVDQMRGAGHEVLRLVRRAPASADERTWDPAAGRLDPAIFEGVDAVVHLSGANLGDKRWTGEYKQVLRDSRIVSTGLVSRTLADLPHPPGVLVCASAVGYYGDCGERHVDETAPPGEGFLVDLVVDWERATAPASEAGVRVVLMRSGIVLAPDGGALKKMLPIFKAGLGARLGSGQQWWSWIAVHDQLAAMRYLVENDAVRGPVNVVAPHPVRNVEFTRSLARALHRPAALAAPAFALRLLFGELADAGLLWSQHVVPQALLDAGFSFRHPDLDGALASLLQQDGPAPRPAAEG
ncbi:MAG TPA: TIGR01777 family oxidoreductase [Mycobacteriales bacterium]|jgi:uncharacterized protein (TIGR01777 family)|nr:TIGR01777 family oxidoreductase [Mycobacteriales bacterium]